MTQFVHFVKIHHICALSCMFVILHFKKRKRSQINSVSLLGLRTTESEVQDESLGLH